VEMNKIDQTSRAKLLPNKFDVDVARFTTPLSIFSALTSLKVWWQKEQCKVKEFSFHVLFKRHRPDLKDLGWLS